MSKEVITSNEVDITNLQKAHTEAGAPANKTNIEAKEILTNIVTKAPTTTKVDKLFILLPIQE